MTSPTRFGRYLLMKRIATGGMAEIFLAKLMGAEGFEKQLVIKKILPHWSSNSEFTAMLVDEAKIVVQLSHPHIVQVYELGREQETCYIAMEYVDGMDLKELVERSKQRKEILPLDVAVPIMIDSLSALAYAHEKRDLAGKPLGIVHRDVSPQNLLISLEGVVKITDFGIAKAASRGQETVSGVLKGKFAYMSPEQALGESLDHRSDLFSAAAVFYELLTGERLFSGGEIETLDKVRRARIFFSPEAERQIPGELKSILLQALKRDPAERFASAAQFRERLLHFAEHHPVPLKVEAIAAYLKILPPRPKETASPFHAETRLVVPEISGKKQLRPWLWGGLLLLLAFPVVMQRYLSRSARFPVAVNQAKSAVDLKADSTSPTGFINIQVVPWGHVSIDGARRLETPVRQLPLKAGRHHLEVYYAPENRSLTTTVQLEPEQRLSCVANFSDKRGIQCRAY